MSDLLVFSQEKAPSLSGSLPKCPYADVFSYIGLLSPNISLIPLGLRSKLSLILSSTNLFLSKSLSKTGPKCILKLIVDKNNNKVLGCHMIGDNASEIIQMASISLMLGAKKSDFDNTMALHPTIAEEFVTMR